MRLSGTPPVRLLYQTGLDIKLRISQGVLSQMSVLLRLFPRVIFAARRVAASSAVATVMAILFLSLLSQAGAQEHKKHETTASRQRKIAATIEDTYTHRFDAFVGGGFMTFRPGQAIAGSGTPPVGVLKSNDEGVWAAHTTYFFSPKLGATGAVQGQYGEADTGNNGYGVLRPNISQYSFMAGPEFRFYAKENTAVSVHALAGVTYGIFDGDDKAIPPPDLGLWSDGIKAAGAIGFNIDHNIYSNLAIRLQPTGTINTFGGRQQYSYGFNAGVVYRFGRQGENNIPFFSKKK
jgi:hypothetical protein